MNKMLIILSATMLFCCSCSQKKTQTENNTDMHTAENALDYHGVYRDTTPFSNNANLIIVLKLSPDNNFVEKSYLLTETDTLSQLKGTYVVTGNILTLTSEDGNIKRMFIEEGRLRMLDDQGNKLSDNYTLQKEYI